MSVNAIQLDKALYTSRAETKDKVLSVRIEENLYELLEKLTGEWETGSVSKTVRTMFLNYLIPEIYEEQWKKIHSKSLENYIKKLLSEGDRIELEKYKELLEQFSEYMKHMRKVVEDMKASQEFFEGELEKLEEGANKLEAVSILWKGDLFEGKKKQNENEPVS